MASGRSYSRNHHTASIATVFRYETPAAQSRRRHNIDVADDDTLEAFFKALVSIRVNNGSVEKNTLPKVEGRFHHCAGANCEQRIFSARSDRLRAAATVSANAAICTPRPASISTSVVVSGQAFEPGNTERTRICGCVALQGPASPNETPRLVSLARQSIVSEWRCHALSSLWSDGSAGFRHRHGHLAINLADRETAITALQTGLDLGMNHIDTAEIYGDAELVIGDAIRGRRDGAFIAARNAEALRALALASRKGPARFATSFTDAAPFRWKKP